MFGDPLKTEPKFLCATMTILMPHYYGLSFKEKRK